jgi:hypothetical protein
MSERKVGDLHVASFWFGVGVAAVAVFVLVCIGLILNDSIFKPIGELRKDVVGMKADIEYLQRNQVYGDKNGTMLFYDTSDREWKPLKEDRK